MLRNRAKFGKKRILNRGISGDITAGVLHRLDEVIRHQPKQIFILIGTNDLARKVPQREVVANIYQIVGRIVTGSPRTKVYVQSVFPVNPTFNSFPGHVKNSELIEAVNAELQQNQDKTSFHLRGYCSSLKG